VNEKVLTAIGLTMDDVPTNWVDFLDFLYTLPQIIPEDSGIMPFYADMSAEATRAQLFYQIFTDYQNYVNATDPTIGYDTELLHTLLDKLERIDFVAMGYEPEDENGEMSHYRVVTYGEDIENRQLFDMGTGCAFGCFYGETKPLLLSIDAQAPRYLVLQTAVAFINPFTRNPEQALAFMETLTDNLPNTVLYSVDPSLSEPIRGEYNEKTLKEVREELDDLYAQRDAASAQDKQAIEETIRDWEGNLDYIEREGWDIAQWHIDWYRANDESLTVMPANWLYSSDSGEAYELINQYLEGLISADELVAGIDKKVRMRLLEGN